MMKQIAALYVGLITLLSNSLINADVVVHYSFDTGYQDQSGNGNHGILFDSDDNDSASIEADAAVFGAGGMRQGDNADRVDLTTPFAPTDGEPWTIAFWSDLSGGAASYGFNTTNQHGIQVRADTHKQVNIWVAGVQYSFDSSASITQNSVNNHIVIVANPSGIDQDGVVGDDKFAVYVNGDLLVPEASQDLTDASVSTAVEVTLIGDSEQWPYGAPGDYDEFYIFDEALTGFQVFNLYGQNQLHRHYFVSADSASELLAQDGYTWATAYGDLQQALEVAVEGDEIWLAKGVYYPDVDYGIDSGDANASFVMKQGVSLYGGFSGNGTEVARAERDPETHVTISIW